MNGESVELWKEYVKLELGYMESVRRRWEVLGIEIGESESVLNGGVVEVVISNAATAAVRRVEMHDSLRDVIAEYPMDGVVRQKLLDHLQKCYVI